MRRSRALYLQSGGVTAVLNVSACGVIETARQHGLPVLAARYGFAGLLSEDLLDTTAVADDMLAHLRDLPGGSFGASRRLLRPYEQAPAEWERVRDVLAAHDIDTLFINGGNGSMDSAHTLSTLAERLQYPLTVIGVPKTIDNDLMLTDCSPGFGSAAKYLATSMREAGMDVRSMAGGRRVFILEAMGRHTGWLAGACALAAEGPGEPPHIVLMPEVPFDLERFLSEVESCLARYNCCTIAVAEGLVDQEGRAIAEQRSATVYGHEQLGGIGGWLAQRIRERTGVTCHAAVADYLQRAGRHLASAMDVAQAYAAGAEAVRLALAGTTDVMTTIERLQDEPYRWQISTAPLGDIGDREKPVPREFIRDDGLHVTEAFLRYLRPLIAGEAPPAFRNGLPDYRPIPWPVVQKRLPAFG